jgi:hypothetical protein
MKFLSTLLSCLLFVLSIMPFQMVSAESVGLKTYLSRIVSESRTLSREQTRSLNTFSKREVRRILRVNRWIKRSMRRDRLSFNCLENVYVFEGNISRVSPRDKRYLALANKDFIKEYRQILGSSSLFSLCRTKTIGKVLGVSDVAADTKAAHDQITVRDQGLEKCQENIYHALDLMREEELEHYDFVVNYIDIIDCISFGNGASFGWEDPPRIVIGPNIFEHTIAVLQAGIVHEACHNYQVQRYLYDPSDLNKRLASYDELNADAESECLDIQYDYLYKVGYLTYDQMLEEKKYQMSTEWWKVDLGY